MRRILITGISGVGKSNVIAELVECGGHAVDLDNPPFSQRVDAPDGEITGIGNGQGWVWDLDRVIELLDREDFDPLVVSGTSPNQGEIYPRFDEIVLLSAPVEVLAERLRTRTTNAFDKAADELERALGFKETIKPLLSTFATIEFDTSSSIDTLAVDILRLVSR